MNIFSGCTNLCRLLEKYESLNVLPWCFKGPFCRFGGMKIGQNDKIYSFWVYCVHFHAKKVRNEYFLVVLVFVGK